MRDFLLLSAGIGQAPWPQAARLPAGAQACKPAACGYGVPAAGRLAAEAFQFDLLVEEAQQVFEADDAH